MLQERDSYRSQLNTYERDVTGTSSGTLNSPQQQQRSRIEALEKAAEGYRELVERLEEDLEKTVRGSGNHRHPEYVVGPLLVP
jgi:predicted translin family RNA/ssDNA-binding protein